MTTIEIKEYIFKNDKVPFVLEKLGCGHIFYHDIKGYYSASFPDGDNKHGIVIYNNSYLNYHSYSRAYTVKEHSDIISLVEYVNSCSFIDAFKWLHTVLNIDYKWAKAKPKPKNKAKLLDVFDKYCKCSRFNVADIQVMDENVLDEFVPLLHIDWYRDGIMPWTREKFGLAYSYRKKRVVIPIRYWLTGELLGANMRTTVKDYSLFDIKKYLLTPSYKKSSNVYALFENKESIQKSGYVIVYEAERSVLKRDSVGDSTGVAIQGHILSDEQVRILIGLDVDIVIAMDNDIGINEIRAMCERFYGIRNVYYIKDSNERLGKKDSPVDMGDKVFTDLFKCKIKYDKSEHKKFLDYMKDR